MTSSLVGSEMCIRDRCSCVSGPVYWTGGAISALCGASSRPFCSADTVSYTHLTLPTICSV
eukprot:11479045-Prorocentrum_lima.AAC.1